MKRLRAIEQKASRLVNQTVLDFYGIKLNPKKDLANLDKVTIHAIKQAMIFAVTHRYPDQYDWITDLLVDCVLSFVMHAGLFPTDNGETEPSVASEHIRESQQDECTNVTVPNPAANEAAQALPLKVFEKLIVQIAELSQQLNVDDAFIQSLSAKHLRQFTDLLGDSMQRIDDVNNRLQDEINEREYNRRGIPEPSMTAQQDSLPAA